MLDYVVHKSWFTEYNKIIEQNVWLSTTELCIVSIFTESSFKIIIIRGSIVVTDTTVIRILSSNKLLLYIIIIAHRVIILYPFDTGTVPSE
jgi:hypothetical protein